MLTRDIDKLLPIAVGAGAAGALWWYLKKRKYEQSQMAGLGAARKVRPPKARRWTKATCTKSGGTWDAKARQCSLALAGRETPEDTLKRLQQELADTDPYDTVRYQAIQTQIAQLTTQTPVITDLTVDASLPKPPKIPDEVKPQQVKQVGAVALKATKTLQQELHDIQPTVEQIVRIMQQAAVLMDDAAFQIPDMPDNVMYSRPASESETKDLIAQGVIMDDTQRAAYDRSMQIWNEIVPLLKQLSRLHDIVKRDGPASSDKSSTDDDAALIEAGLTKVTHTGRGLAFNGIKSIRPAVQRKLAEATNGLTKLNDGIRQLDDAAARIERWRAMAGAAISNVAGAILPKVSTQEPKAYIYHARTEFSKLQPAEQALRRQIRDTQFAAASAMIAESNASPKLKSTLMKIALDELRKSDKTLGARDVRLHKAQQKMWARLEKKGLGPSDITYTKHRIIPTPSGQEKLASQKLTGPFYTGVEGPSGAAGTPFEDTSAKIARQQKVQRLYDKLAELARKAESGTVRSVDMDELRRKVDGLKRQLRDLGESSLAVDAKGPQIYNAKFEPASQYAVGHTNVLTQPSPLSPTAGETDDAGLPSSWEGHEYPSEAYPSYSGGAALTGLQTLGKSKYAKGPTLRVPGLALAGTCPAGQHPIVSGRRKGECVQTGCPRGMFRSGSGKCVYAEGGQSPYGFIPRLFHYTPPTDGSTGGQFNGLQGETLQEELDSCSQHGSVGLIGLLGLLPQ